MPRRAVTCKKRSRSRCNNAKKSCMYVNTTKRRYCRKRRNIITPVLGKNIYRGSKKNKKIEYEINPIANPKVNYNQGYTKPDSFMFVNPMR